MGKITNLYAEPLYRISDSREAIDFFFPCGPATFVLIALIFRSCPRSWREYDPISTYIRYSIISITKENKELFSLSLSLSLRNQRSCFK